MLLRTSRDIVNAEVYHITAAVTGYRGSYTFVLALGIMRVLICLNVALPQSSISAA